MKYLLFVIVFCHATFLSGQYIQIFDDSKELISILVYLKSCKITELSDKEKLLNTQLLDFGLKPTNDSVVRIANNDLKIDVSSSNCTYKSDDNSLSLYIERFEQESEVFPAWVNINSKIKVHSGNLFYYFKLDTLYNASLNVSMYTKNSVLNIQKIFPFVLSELDDLSEDQLNQITNARISITKILNCLARNLSLKSDQLYYPSNGELYGRALTASERLYGFINFWTEVKYNFAFFDQVPHLNWDEVLRECLPRLQEPMSNLEYYKLLSAVCAKLEDGHTNVYYPFDLRLNLYAPNVKLNIFENGIFVTNTTQKYKDQVPLGAKIIRVNHIEVNQYMEDELYPYISSSTKHIKEKQAVRKLLKIENGKQLNCDFVLPSGETTSVEFKDFENDTTSWIVEDSYSNKIVDFEMLNGGIAVLGLNGFFSEQVVEEFISLIDSIKTAKTLIIDLRENTGGNSAYGYEILKYLSKKPYLTSKWMTREHKASYKAWGKDIEESKLNTWEKECLDTYNGDFWYVAPPDTIEPYYNNTISIPIIMLVGNNTASAAEDFLVAADYIGLTETVGDYTFGSTGQPLEIRLPGGGSARICTKKDVYPDGREFVGYGIKPKYLVKPNLQDVLDKRDVVLRYALKLARSKK